MSGWGVQVAAREGSLNFEAGRRSQRARPSREFVWEWESAWKFWVAEGVAAGTAAGTTAGTAAGVRLAWLPRADGQRLAASVESRGCDFIPSPAVVW